MRLTDIFEGHDFHEISHRPEMMADSEERINRIRDYFGDPIARCLVECQGLSGTELSERYCQLMALLCTLDAAIEAVTKDKQ